MKLSCLPVSLFSDICDGKMDVVDWALAARNIGFDGFDISVMLLKNRTQTYLNELKSKLRDIGLPGVMMATYPDFTNPDKTQREREKLYFKNDIALCSELGMKYLRLLAGQQHDGLSKEESIELACEAFREVDACAQDFGVGLVFENHGKPGAWDNYDFTFDPYNFLEICKNIKDTNIRVNFDTGNVTAFGLDSMEILPHVIDLVETIHLTDMQGIGVFKPTVIGTGVTPNREIFSYLKQNGFENWVCIEEASGTGFDGIRKAFDYVKKAWEEA